MARDKKMSRLVQIGLSRSDKAKILAGKGFYEDALVELGVALEAFRQENDDGKWDDAVAGLLNNIGFLDLALYRYDNAIEAFEEAAALKIKAGREPVAGTLIGMAEAYRGTCDFFKAEDALEEAMESALSDKDDSLAMLAFLKMESLDRTKNDMPAGIEKGETDFFMPSIMNDIDALIPSLKISLDWGRKLSIEMIIGYPGLLKDIKYLIPCLGILMDEDDRASLVKFMLSDEEGEVTPPRTIEVSGNVFAPGSYHPQAPLPLPKCKRYRFLHGNGWVFQWKPWANGWYHVACDVKLSRADSHSILLLMPYHVTRIKNVYVNVQPTVLYRGIRLSSVKYRETDDMDETAMAIEKTTLAEKDASAMGNIPIDAKLEDAGIIVELFNPSSF